MGTWEFGLTVALVGSVGTLLVLWLLSLLILLIKKIFPFVRLPSFRRKHAPYPDTGPESRRAPQSHPWIPAFAGMTEGVPGLTGRVPGLTGPGTEQEPN